MELYGLKTNERINAIGIDGVPYFSWKIASDSENVSQVAYRIVIPGFWDTGKVESKEQAFIEYSGEALHSCTEYCWHVTVWDNYGNKADAEAVFETAEPNWQAKWVESTIKREAADEYKYGPSYPAVLFGRSFELPGKKVVRARVYATAFGIYQLRINGIRPDDREFAPEFTSYEKLHYYQTYDVAALLHEGTNRIEMHVGDGWYFSNQASPILGERHPEPSVLYQVQLWYEDGTQDCLFSDGSETCALGNVLCSDLFQGEKQDMRRIMKETNQVIVREYGYDTLAAQPMDPIRPMKLLPAMDVFTTPKGECIVDFGQVLAGRARIKVDIPRDQEAAFEYFEILDKDGNYINTMFAPQKDTVISAGEAFVHEALFTFHGFRYIKVTGIKEVRKEDYTAVLLTTEKENAGDFACSEPRLTRLYQNVRWSQWNNMMSVPTDCPSREKAGWTGDILIYAKAALTNENVTAFLTSWLRNVRADQKNDGTVMITSPFEKLYDGLIRNVCLGFGDTEPTNVAGWSDAIVWVPYEMYQVTGNRVILQENYEAMARFCEALITTANLKRSDMDIPEEYDRWLVNTGFHFGEWLIPSEPVGGFDICKTSAYYVAPFFAYESMRKMAVIAEVLGKHDDAAHYGSTADKMKGAILNGLIYADRLPKEKMGAYVLAFAFGLVPENLKEEYANRLAGLLEANGNCLDTGFLPTAFLLDVLCNIGREDLARTLLWQNKMPSWLYEVEKGATAIWEAWNADEARETGRFVSFDHYAFGIVDDWIMRRLCGIDSDRPGYSHLLIAPLKDQKITWLKRSFISVAGKVSVEYEGENLTVMVPPNASATVIWNGKQTEVGSGTYQFT